MTQIIQSGSINTAGLIVPDAVVQIVPPGVRPISSVSTNTLGVVGSATWGPVGVATPIGTIDQQVAAFGPVQNRVSDLGTAVAVAIQQGAQIMQSVRVTDGSDVAASAALVDGSAGAAGTIAALYTGSRGNGISWTLSAGSAANTSRVVVSLSGLTPETFDNLSAGVTSVTVVPGTGFTSVPTLAFAAPQIANGVQALGSATLAVIGTPTIGAGGTGHVVNDFITYSNGVVLKVASVSGGAILTYFPVSTSGCNAGSITSGATPTNPVAQISTTGVGVGSTATLVWGLGPVTMTQQGSGYSAAPAITATGGGGSGSSLTAVITIWQNIANAINNGQNGVRGRSNIVTFTAGAGTGIPVIATTNLAGGSDGVAAITSATLIGVDTAPRKGMYALRGAGCAVATLADLSDSTKFNAMATFGLSEGIFMGAATPAGDTIANAATTLSSIGLDSYAMKVLFGDWIYWYDGFNSVTRLISPATFWAGLRASISPQNSTLNKTVSGVSGTQKSISGGSYSTAETQTLINARLDLIANPIPAGTTYGPRSGNNTSSNTAINGENYTMMTNFLAKAVGAWGGGVVGQLQTPDQRREAKAAIDNFLSSLWINGIIGNAQGSVPWQTILDDSNNPVGSVTAGYEYAAVSVQYLSVVRFFIVNLQGGQTVTISAQATQPTFGT